MLVVVETLLKNIQTLNSMLLHEKNNLKKFSKKWLVPQILKNPQGPTD